jgi:hypothetical protein
MVLNGNMDFENKTTTLTYGDVAENHVGMQKLGTLADNGFDLHTLTIAKQRFEEKGYKCTLVKLHSYLKIANIPEAYVLIIRKGVNCLLSDKGHTADDLFSEHDKLDVDKKALMRGKVVNKKARYNLCFAENAQEPDYDAGKGRIVAFADVPLTMYIRSKLSDYVNDAEQLLCEGNYYYDVNTCGIGYHGDTERRKVIGIRIGKSMDLCYRWYYKNNPVGSDILRMTLHHGDIYIMSEKATGYDWKRSSIYTLRHAAGCSKYTMC